MSRSALVVLALVACQSPPVPDSVAPPARTAAWEPSGHELLVGADVPQTPALTRAVDWAEQKIVRARPNLKTPAAIPVAPTLTAPGKEGVPSVPFVLRHTQVRAKVTGTVSRVEVMQLFHNPTRERLEAVYAFPLPANAAVTDMYFRIGKRLVYSEVQKRGQARQTYEAARREGKTAALTEQERPNLFTQSVANIPPGEAVAVFIRYLHEVPLDDGRYQFVFPTTVGPRYLPQSGVKDAERITPPVVSESPADLDLQVQLTPANAFSDIAAVSHEVVTGLDGDGARWVALGENDRRLNKDFILSWAPSGLTPTAHAITEKDRDGDYLMLMVQPPAEVEARTVRPKEMVFLIDVSGSMGGRPLDAAKALVAAALERMGPQDTFQLIAFASDTQQMSPQPLPNTEQNIQAARKWLTQMNEGGGTEMMKGIYAALSPPSDPKRLRMVVFCTDGYIGNEEEILQATRKYRDQARVFGFGIGSSVNRYLIEGMGREGRGAHDVVGISEPIAPAVERLYKRLDRPVLTDVSLDFEGLQVFDRQPEALPDLMAGQPLVVVAKLSHGNAGKVVLKGRYAGAPWSREIPVEVVAREGAPVLGTLWARRKIDSLSWGHNASASDTVDAITALGLKFKLITAHTSFVAVERELLADAHLPLTQALVPNEMPQGSFGDPAAVEVTPSRVKPGDPEIRVKAAPTARAVRVKLPFEAGFKDARWDPHSGEFVHRFLVPSAFADGTYAVAIDIQHEDGHTETRTSPLKVDTTPSAVAVLSADPVMVPGRTFTLSLKPALPLSQLSLDGEALKAAMETKEVLVHAPWGETVFAQMGGPLGVYSATLHVPEGITGMVKLEIASSDAAGNVSRRAYEVPAQSKRLSVGWMVAAMLGLALVLRARSRS